MNNWIITRDKRKLIKINHLVKFTPEQKKQLKKMAKIIEEELTDE